MRVLSKICHHCGEKFTGTNAHGRTSWRRRRYCSVRCKVEAQRVQRAPVRTKSCAVCQRKFRNRRTSGRAIEPYKWALAKYCSPQCRGMGMLGRAPPNKGHRLDVREQFERYVDKISSPNGCWLWTGTRNRAGYGGLQVNGKKSMAHRVSYVLHKGEIPERPGFHGTIVCHNCDTPACVNPNHLLLGSQFDNMRDRDAKGRRKPTVGSSHGMAKLQERDVRAIRFMAETHTQKEMALQFKVSVATISLIINRRNWTHI